MGRIYQESRRSTKLLLSIVIGTLITMPAGADGGADEMVGYVAGVIESCDWYMNIGGNATITATEQNLTILYNLPRGRYNQPTIERVLVEGFNVCLKVVRRYPSLEYCCFAIGAPDKEIVAAVFTGNSTLNHTA